jgi:prepilin-type N-terminal cleavage/methylation domain-containing protein
MQTSSQRGFSLIEVMIAMGVLTVGVLGAAAVLAAGMQNLSSSPGDVVVTQKAAQAIEAVFAARDSHRLAWAQIQNVSNNGIFVDGPTPLTLAGPDGLVNTTDDPSTIESTVLPGKDQIFGTGDDVTVVLSAYTRQITITDVPGESGDLRKIAVTVTYRNGQTVRTYTLTTYISSFA